MNRKISIVVIVLFMLLLTGCMSASFSGDYVIREGRSLRGDLFVTSGTVTLEENSQVTGSIFMTSGVIRMEKNSEVGKDVVITSGDIFMAEGSVIHGDLVTTSSDIGLHQAQGATIEGNTTFDIAPFAIGFGFRVLLLCCLLPVIGVIVLVLLLGALIGRRSKRKVKSVPVNTPVETEDTKARLQTLMNMLNDGLITQEDYEAKKAEILSKM